MKENTVFWPALWVGQKVQFWSHGVGANSVTASYEGVEISISLFQSNDYDCLLDFYLDAVIESMNAVLHSFGVQLQYRGEFFVNDEGVEEELNQDHPFVKTILTKFWGDEGEWKFNWGDFVLCRDFDESFRLPEGGKFEPYTSYIVVAI